MTPERVQPRWSIGLGALFGIPIRVHVSFLFLVVWFLAWAGSTGQDLTVWLIILGLVLLCVIVHELGHAGVAALYGIRTREIVLYPIGGVARLERLPMGIAELSIAVAGPLVNLVVAIFGFGTLQALGLPTRAPADAAPSHLILSALVLANLMLFLFNLVPAFPMDGGRVLRACLTLFMGEASATRLAVGVGQLLAFFFALWALFGPMPDAGSRLLVMLIAFLVLIGANQELLGQRTRSRVRGRTASEAMMTRVETLEPQQSLEWASRLFLATHQRDFPVVDAWGRVAGLLDRQRLMTAIAELGPEASILQAMDREFASVQPDTPLEDVLPFFQGGTRVVVVTEDDELRGLLTLEKLGQWIEILERLERAAARPADA